MLEDRESGEVLAEAVAKRTRFVVEIERLCDSIEELQPWQAVGNN